MRELDWYSSESCVSESRNHEPLSGHVPVRQDRQCPSVSTGPVHLEPFCAEASGDVHRAIEGFPDETGRKITLNGGVGVHRLGQPGEVAA